jgi:penicillin-binding protein 1C
VKISVRTWKRRLLVGALGLCAAASVGWWLLPLAVPLPEKLAKPPPASPVFLAADGSPLRQLLDEEGQRSQPVSFEEIPEILLHATLAAEDKRFFQHHGIDFAATARALRDDVLHRRIVSGASTITQQLAKVAAEKEHPRTLVTKLWQGLQARRLEMTFSKERILSEYLNRISYGNLLTGCRSAAQGYLNKPLRDLTPAESAFIAALPQSPSRLNPYKNMPAVRKRQHLILDRMHQLGWLSAEDLHLAQTEAVTLHHFTGGFAAPHAVQLAAAGAVASGVVRTTIDTALQARTEAIISHRLALLGPKHVTQAAAVIIENESGCIRALAGSRGFYSSGGGQINGAWTPHSPGSAIKPFTYLLALQNGFTAGSIIPDLPIEFSTPTGLYRPENYDHKTHGPVTLRTALGSSLNIPAVRVLHQIGGESRLQQTLQSAGLTTLDESSDHYGLGLTIGNAPVRLVELANAYACLARLGDYKPWTLYADEKASVSKRLFPARECFIIADILSDNDARVLTFGAHSVLRLPFRCAVKTGTSTGYRDNWALGFTPAYTVGVWVGNFDNSPMNQVSGVAGAGPIFRDLFTALHEKRTQGWFPAPEGLVQASIDPRNGKLVTDSSPPVSNAHSEWFCDGTLPSPATANDYEADSGRAFIPAEYAAWHKQEAAWMTKAVVPRSASELEPLRITNPISGTIFQLDPELSAASQTLLLRSTRGDDVEWSSPTLTILHTASQPQAMLKVGSHKIIARTKSTSQAASVWIEVRPPVSAASVRSQ